MAKTVFSKILEFEEIWRYPDGHARKEEVAGIFRSGSQRDDLS